MTSKRTIIRGQSSKSKLHLGKKCLSISSFYMISYNIKYSNYNLILEIYEREGFGFLDINICHFTNYEMLPNIVQNIKHVLEELNTQNSNHLTYHVSKTRVIYGDINLMNDITQTFFKDTLLFKFTKGR